MIILKQALQNDHEEIFLHENSKALKVLKECVFVTNDGIEYSIKIPPISKSSKMATFINGCIKDMFEAISVNSFKPH